MKSREITPMTCFAIDSEPGDMTHYQYVIITHYEDYSVAPLGSAIRFPQVIRGAEVDHADDEMIQKIAYREQCNVWTVKEVINAIKELRGEKDTKK